MMHIVETGECPRCGKQIPLGADGEVCGHEPCELMLNAYGRRCYDAGYDSGIEQGRALGLQQASERLESTVTAEKARVEREMSKRPSVCDCYVEALEFVLAALRPTTEPK